jgi:hypothetical protein
MGDLPFPDGGGGSPEAAAPQSGKKKGNPYDDLPANDAKEPSPFDDPQAFSRPRPESSAWVTALLKKLNSIAPGGWAGQLPKGTYRFRVKICQDGKISRTYDKGGTATPDFKQALRKEITRIKLGKPIPTRDLAVGMCKTIPYVFIYSSGRVK